MEGGGASEEEMRQKAEEEVRQKVEEEAEQKAEVKAQRRAETEAKARAQSSVSGTSKGKQPKVVASGAGGGLALCYGCSGAGVACEMKTARGDMQSTWQRKWEEVMSPQVRKKKAWMQSLVVDEEDDNEEVEEAEEEYDTLGALTEVLVAVVMEMQDMAADQRHAAEESYAQSERMLGILEEIQGCLDLEYAPDELEVGLEEEFKEEEVAEAAEEGDLEGPE
ncbi:hypothetical protein PAXRUDRAFT_16402 [Paxillus rubicundulus Ve08.2h10]|uniref:Uncharacterized protein n=1 Tax=Paxillus rubicundulus Ve08.2h10 TaxID=930991 RepID=A0A0D0DLQ2_9AGAM|nr:hypothetical protein PAXRUDRAFT_16402 [Paxillus rubicundulus Ve08.2h10]